MKTNNGHVYIVQHTRRLFDGTDDTKLIGAFSTTVAAHRCVAELRSVAGFKESPSGFSVDRYELDKVYWTEGFVEV